MVSLEKRAQAGLEYLMTYGWALILVATLVGILIFVYSPPVGGANFSSDDLKIPLKAGSAEPDGSATVVVQNATGGKITLNSASFFGGLGAKQSPAVNGQTLPAEIGAGSEMVFEGLGHENYCSEGGAMVMSYTDFSGFERTAEVHCNSAAEMPVAWYKFDDGTAKDYSGNGNGGVLAGPTPTGVCASGSCLSFDGLDDYISITDATAFDSAEWSVTAWVNIGSGDYQTLLSFNYEQVPLVRVSHGSNPLLYLNSGANDYYKYGNLDIKDNAWHHIAFLFRDSDTYVRVFVDGSDRTGPGPLTGNEAPVTSTWRISASSYTVNGLIDEVKVYNRALSAFEACSSCWEHANAVGVTCNC